MSDILQYSLYRHKNRVKIILWYSTQEENMYKNGFVLSIKDSNDYILRDEAGKVLMPFYEEFKLYLKNTHSRKALAKITIDGEDVLNGRQLIISPNDSIELERFVDNLKEGRRFQFAPLKDERQKDKNDAPDVGIIEVKFQRETEDSLWKPLVWKDEAKYTERYYTPTKHYFTTNISTADGMNTGYSIGKLSTKCATSFVGKTVEGSRSKQEFNYGSIGELEDNWTTIRMRLIPADYNTPTTTKETKYIFCTDCGNKSPRKSKFCWNCGKGLTKQ